MKSPFADIHPEGDLALANSLNEIASIPVDTFGGRVHVEWDPQAEVTPLGQLPFFIEFLKTSELFDPWVDECPLTFESNNAPSKRDVLGTFLLSILAGQKRYAHITALRCDHVNPGLLGMTKVVSEDAARRAMKKIPEMPGTQWLSNHLQKCYLPLLSIPWIMDIDTTVKPLYGHQEGAEVGYNPTKPGRPSHAYHTYHIANIRMILDVEIEDGKSVAGCYSAPHLWELLKNIPTDHWPRFIRGDSSYGNEGIMREAERRLVNYLFKLKCTGRVKQLIALMMKTKDWLRAGQGWEGIDSEIRLHGWSQSRRVVLLRKALPQKNIGVVNKKAGEQMEFQFAQVNKDMIAYEYQVLVTNLDDELVTIAQHYRDRADCENNFDELKNQWGWCGYTTQDLKRSRLMAKMIALIYNWWTIFTRLANPHSHLEAVTSRPLLLHAVAKQTHHAGQTKLTVSSTHSKSTKISAILRAISSFLRKIKDAAEHLTSEEKLRQILMVAFRKFLPKERLECLNVLLCPG